MGRTVGDVATLFEAVAGPIRAIPRALPSTRPAIRPWRGCALPSVRNSASTCPSTRMSLTRSRTRWTPVGAGWRIARADPAWPAGISEASIMPLQLAGLAALHGQAWQQRPELFDPDIGAQIERGLALTGAEVARALEASRASALALAAFFTEHDLLLTPTTPCVAWPQRPARPRHDRRRRCRAARARRVHAALQSCADAGAFRSLRPGRDRLPVGLQIDARAARGAFCGRAPSTCCGRRARLLAVRP